jgi:hypothetical protein
MKRAILLAGLVLIAGCRKRPQPTVPPMPDSSPMAAGGNNELPQATVFHTMYRYPGHANAVISFYKDEMDRRGARPATGGYGDDNLVHSGDFGKSGFAQPKDPTKPGVWLAVQEVQDATYIDVWESVPNP